MIKSIGKITLATILAAVVLGLPMGAMAQTNMAPATETPAAPTKASKAIVFNGKILSVDDVNKTITLDEKTKRTFAVTSKTKLIKDGKPATFADAVVGDVVGGRYTKDADGKMTATSIRFGVKPKPTAADAAAAK